MSWGRRCSTSLKNVHDSGELIGYISYSPFSIYIHILKVSFINLIDYSRTVLVVWIFFLYQTLKCSNYQTDLHFKPVIAICAFHRCNFCNLGLFSWWCLVISENFLLSIAVLFQHIALEKMGLYYLKFWYNDEDFLKNHCHIVSNRVLICESSAANVTSEMFRTADCSGYRNVGCCLKLCCDFLATFGHVFLRSREKCVLRMAWNPFWY